MKQLLILTFVLFLSVSGFAAGPSDPYPAELRNFLPQGAQFNSNLSSEKKNRIEAERPAYKNRRASPLPTANVYVFTVSVSPEEVKRVLQQERIALREVPLPGGGKSGEKLFTGKSGPWHISLASHFLDVRQKRWTRQTTLTFIKIISRK